MEKTTVSALQSQVVVRYCRVKMLLAGLTDPSMVHVDNAQAKAIRMNPLYRQPLQTLLASHYLQLQHRLLLTSKRQLMPLSIAPAMAQLGIQTRLQRLWLWLILLAVLA